MTGIAVQRSLAGRREAWAEGRAGQGRATELWLDKSPAPPKSKPLTWLVFWRADRSAAVPLASCFPAISRGFAALGAVFHRGEDRDGR